ncbi:MAG: hypothetical protein H6719_02245 [Sandaracinaceae bacterium]|nr:hypothetical protein [Sandaracinaceae bacterium]
MTRTLRSWLLRLAAGGILVACIVGPAPGNVGGCGASNPIADAREHCINQRFWECRRDLAGGRINEAQYNDCLLPIASACDAASWPVGCEPTNSQSDACIILLSRADRANIPTADLLTMFSDCNFCR